MTGSRIARGFFTFALLATTVSAPGSGTSAASAAQPAVIVLVVDGLEPETTTPEMMPNLFALMRDGEARRWTRASSVMISDTNSNHTAIVTGTHADRSGILANNYFNIRAGTQGAREAMERPSLIRVPTLFDAIEAQQPDLRTASIMGKEKLRKLFDCTRAPSGVCGPSSDNPEGVSVSHVRPDFVGGATTNFDPDSHEHDAIAEPASGTGYAADNEVIDIVIAQHTAPTQPDFTFVNLGVIDGIQHVFGGRSPEGLGAVLNADMNIGRLVAALKESGRWDDTVLFVLADHSFNNAGTELPPGTSVTDPVTPYATGRVMVLSELLGSCTNGTAYSAISNAAVANVSIKSGFDPYAGTTLTEEHKACLKQLRGRALANPNVAEALYRLPVEGTSGLLDTVHPDWRLGTPRLGELFLVAKEGSSFVEARASSVSLFTGAHGGPATTPIPFFVASGSDALKPGTETSAAASNIDIAPTVAWLLGIEPPAASEGRVLCEAFEGCDG